MDDALHRDAKPERQTVIDRPARAGDSEVFVKRIEVYDVNAQGERTAEEKVSVREKIDLVDIPGDAPVDIERGVAPSCRVRRATLYWVTTPS